MGRYKNKLRLQGIPRIEEIRPQNVGLFFGKSDEFVHIADTLKGWKRARKSLANYVEDEEHREALLNDLYQLRDWIALELLEEKRKPLEDQVQRFIERREYFLSETVPYEEGRLLSWEPPIERENRFDFQNLRGNCILTYQSGAVTKLRLQLQEKGIFSIGWKQAGDIGEEVEPIEKEIRVDGSTAVIIKLPTPRRSGTLYILNHTRKAVERVPL